MIEYATVYGRFYRETVPINGEVVFTPAERYYREDGELRSLSVLRFDVIDGIMVSNGSPGASVPASTEGLRWNIFVLPLNYVNVLQLFPGNIMSIGD